jgi:hypothetical protein
LLGDDPAIWNSILVVSEVALESGLFEGAGAVVDATSPVGEGDASESAVAGDGVVEVARQAFYSDAIINSGYGGEVEAVGFYGGVLAHRNWARKAYLSQDVFSS